MIKTVYLSIKNLNTQESCGRYSEKRGRDKIDDMTEAKHNWKEVKERGSLGRMRLLLSLYRLFGKPALYVIVSTICMGYFIIDRQARGYSQNYLAHLAAFQERPLSRGQRLKAGLCHFMSFGKTLVDKIDAWTGTLHVSDLIFDDRPRYEALVEKLYAGKGAVMIGAHLGNMELLRAVSTMRKGLVINVLVYTKHSKVFRTILSQVNPKAELNLIHVDEMNMATSMMLKEKVNKGELVIITGDRIAIHGNDSSEVLSFLGKPAYFPKGPFILAHVLECPVFFFFCFRKANKYHFVLEEVAEKLDLPRKNRAEALREVMTRYVKTLEKYCMQYPYQWYNFHAYWVEDFKESEARP